MKNNNLIIRKEGKDKYLVSLKGNRDYYMINKTAKIIFDYLIDGMNIKSIKQRLIEDFGLLDSEASSYILKFIQSIKNPKITKIDWELSSPITVGWKITNKCNLYCKHCYASSSGEESDELTWREISKIIDILSSSNVMQVHLTGGEPFVCKDIINIIDRLSKKNIKITIFTNGTLLDKHLSYLKNININYLISLDGLKYEHEMLRGKGTYDTTLNSINRLIEMGKNVTVNVVISKINYKNIHNIIKHIVERNWNYQTNFFLPTGRGKENLNLLALNHDEISDTIVSLSEFSKDNQTRTSIMDITDYDDVKKVYIDEKGDKHILNDDWICSAGRTRLSINPNGDVYPCPFVQTSKIGNILHDKFDKIWNNPKRLEFIDWVSHGSSHLCSPIRNMINEK